MGVQSAVMIMHPSGALGFHSRQLKDSADGCDMGSREMLIITRQENVQVRSDDRVVGGWRWMVDQGYEMS